MNSENRNPEQAALDSRQLGELQTTWNIILEEWSRGHHYAWSLWLDHAVGQYADFMDHDGKLASGFLFWDWMQFRRDGWGQNDFEKELPREDLPGKIHQGWEFCFKVVEKYVGKFKGQDQTLFRQQATALLQGAFAVARTVVALAQGEEAGEHLRKAVTAYATFWQGEIPSGYLGAFSVCSAGMNFDTEDWQHKCQSQLNAATGSIQEAINRIASPLAWDVGLAMAYRGIHWLLNPTQPPNHTSRTRIVLTGDQGGATAWLRLDEWPDATACVLFPDPVRLGLVALDQHWREKFSAAAKWYANDPRGNKVACGWSLAFPCGREVADENVHRPPMLKGDSASGAAAVSRLALRLRQPLDPDVVLTATVDCSGNLRDVGSQLAKFVGRRLLVAKRTAWTDWAAQHNEVQLEEVKTVDEALDRMSGRLVEVLKFLGCLADQLDHTPWHLKSGGDQRLIRATEIHVEPLILTEMDRPKRAGPDDKPVSDGTERFSPLEEVQARLYEMAERASEREELRWRQVICGGRRRLGLRGAPGGGKTFIGKYEVAQRCREAQRKLTNLEVGLDQLDGAVWVTAKSLAGAPSDDTADALIHAMQDSINGLVISDKARQWLREAIHSGRVFVVVDALDELTDREQFSRRSAALNKLRGPVMVTCRTLQWHERLAWLEWPSLNELELAPLQPREQRQLVDNFFQSDAFRKQGMRQLLASNFALRHACTTPLLLTFACMLHEEGKVGKATGTAMLFADIRRKLIRGEWRNANASKPEWAQNKAIVESTLLLLERIAWGLFRRAPQKNCFTLDQWLAAAQEAVLPGTTSPVDPIELLNQLEKTGLLAPGGYEGPRGDACWSFAHRSLLEWFAAAALSRMGQEVWLAEARRHFGRQDGQDWLQPEWYEVLAFLAEMVEDATPLIKAVEEEQKHDDIFRSMLALKVRLAVRARKRELEDEVTQEAFAWWRSTLESPGEAMRDFATSVLIGCPQAVEPLLNLIGDVSCLVHYASVEALGWLEVPRALEPLLTLLGFEDRHAAEALGWLGDARAIEPLMKVMGKNEDWDDERIVAKALSRLGDARTVDPLLKLLGDKDVAVRSAAADVLGRLGASVAVEPLLTLLSDENCFVRWNVAEALGRLRDHRAVEPLLKLLGDKEESSSVRKSSAEALGRLGDPRAVEHLLISFGDGDLYCTAPEALGWLGDARAVDPLLRMLGQEDKELRWKAALALGWLGDARAVEPLLQLLDVKGSRGAAAKALCQLGDSRAVEPLLKIFGRGDWFDIEALCQLRDARAVEPLLMLLCEEYPHIRHEAAEALGQLGDQRTVDPLLSLLSNDENPWVCSAAAVALWRIAASRRIHIGNLPLRQRRKPAEPDDDIPF